MGRQIAEHRCIFRRNGLQATAWASRRIRDNLSDETLPETPPTSDEAPPEPTGEEQRTPKSDVSPPHPQEEKKKKKKG
jgi:hypothetical protein